MGWACQRDLIAWSFVNPKEPVQLVDVPITEDATSMNTVTKKASGLELKVASVAELIAMKRESSRPQDKGRGFVLSHHKPRSS